MADKYIDEDQFSGLSETAQNIGVLELREGKWTFYYTESFKHQDEIKPLVDFPDVENVYTKDELWPFFLIRIPGLKQPQVQEVIDKQNIDPNNQAELLRVFGKKSISNPFVITSAT